MTLSLACLKAHACNAKSKTAGAWTGFEFYIATDRRCGKKSFGKPKSQFPQQQHKKLTKHILTYKEYHRKMKLAFSFFLAISTLIGNAAAVDRPDFDPHARVKQHREKTTGELVAGEEHLRKILLKWDKVPGAEQYQLCHNCNGIEEATGEAKSLIPEDKIISLGVGRKYECGGQACLVMPDSPLGYNTFHLRVQVGDEWSKWSKQRNYKVDEPGTIEHEEL
eukprot:scaffold8658_cov101-Cylindrotheca_fusiformis.AAC.2